MQSLNFMCNAILMFLLVHGYGACLKSTGKHCAKVMVRGPTSPYVDHIIGPREGVASYLLGLHLTFGKVMVWSKPSPLSTPLFINLPNRRLWPATKPSPFSPQDITFLGTNPQDITFEPARYHFLNPQGITFEPDQTVPVNNLGT